jgi:hypothetical protein
MAVVITGEGRKALTTVLTADGRSSPYQSGEESARQRDMPVWGRVTPPRTLAHPLRHLA